MNSILTETLILPDSMSTDTQMFLNNLLDRDPTARLGSHNEADITGHEFFNDLDWDAANQGRLKPPFDPCGTKSLHTAPNVDISVKTKLSTNLRMHEVFEEPSIENSEVEFDGNSFVEGSLKEFSEPSFNEEPLTSSFRKRFWRDLMNDSSRSSNNSACIRRSLDMYSTEQEAKSDLLRLPSIWNRNNGDRLPWRTESR